VVGQGCAIDPERYLILGIDFAADQTGARAPSTYEQAEALGAALALSGRDYFDLIIGASYGGMVALAFAERAPANVERLVIISAPASPHPYATGIRELQRRIVELGLQNGGPDAALSIARGLAMLSYRTPRELAERFEGGLLSDEALNTSDIGAYLRGRGEVFATVMTPHRFLSLSASIDRHRVTPENVQSQTLLIGATTDQLVPPEQLIELGARLNGSSQLHLIDSLYGHDMFLKEPVEISQAITRFRAGVS
jgi:homoserine O-acetyltransferase